MESHRQAGSITETSSFERLWWVFLSASPIHYSMPVWGLIRNIKTLLGFLSWRSPLLWSWKDKPTFVNMWLNAYLWVPLSCLRKGEWHHVLSICHLWCKELRKCGTSFKIENNEENGKNYLEFRRCVRVIPNVIEKNEKRKSSREEHFCWLFNSRAFQLLLHNLEFLFLLCMSSL